MSPDDMAEHAEHAEHMAGWCGKWADTFEGLPAVSLRNSAAMWGESARYWREKAREND